MVRRCRGCGCTDRQACLTDEGACSWVDLDLCSACVAKPQEPAPPVHLRINHETWAVLPGEVLPRDGDGCVSHAIYSATVYLSVPLTHPPQELPALVAIPQASLAQVLANVRSIDRQLASVTPEHALICANVRRKLQHLQQLLGLSS